MIAAVDAVQERDIVAGTVGQPQAEHAGVELDRLRHVAGEQQHMREPARKGAPDAASATGAPRTAGPSLSWPNSDFSSGEDFAATLISTGVPSWSRNQMPFELDARRRVEPRDAHRLQPLGETVDVVLEGAEAEMPELLARTLADRAPDLRRAEGAHARAGRAPLCMSSPNSP